MTLWIIIGVVCIGVLLCFLLAIANHSGERFFERYEEVDKYGINAEISSAQFVDEVNNKYFDGKLKVVQINRTGDDAYNKGTLYLSWQTLSKSSIASFTIIAHEMGHALQDKSGKKLKKLTVLRILGRVLGLLFFPVLIAGIVLLFFEDIKFIIGLSCLGVALLIFLLSLIIKLRTISIEKDASNNAIIFLQEILSHEELKESKKFLKDAKLTYWADFLRIFLWWTGMSRKTNMFN